jgi:Ni,Fe-hydrogenase III large subunit
MAFASFKERAQRIIQALVGHRFLFGSVAVGGSHLSISALSRPQADRASATSRSTSRAHGGTD